MITIRFSAVKIPEAIPIGLNMKIRKQTLKLILESKQGVGYIIMDKIYQYSIKETEKIILIKVRIPSQAQY